KGIHLMKSRIWTIAIVGIVGLGMMLSACQPPSAMTEEEMALRQKAYKDSMKKANMRECMKFLSFATEYYKNKDYEDALRNYKKLFELQCVDEELARDVFVFVGNSYRELNQLDSALYYYDRGLSYIPENAYLRQNKIYTLKLMGDTDGVLAEKAELLRYTPDDMKLAEELVDEYLLNKYFEEAKALAQQILEKDPNNRNVQNILREAMVELGEDIFDMIKARYEEDPANLQNINEYAGLLIERNMMTEATQVLENAVKVNPDNENIMRRLVDVYNSKGNTAQTVTILTKLIKLKPNDTEYQYQITDAYLNTGDHKSALKQAEAIIKANPQDGRAYANRAKVYEEIANACTGAAPDFSDKLVFSMAYEDYLKARDLRYSKIQNKIDFLGEARIPQKGDWFFYRDDYVDKQGYATPQKKCYSWLTRKVKAP
ncbi:MAG: tetratricopeptide repeat protein, partial [Lentisphaeria bacterium]|nr:tetratricopeptide repeat protein [Lentisphaeria bacterium]